MRNSPLIVLAGLGLVSAFVACGGGGTDLNQSENGGTGGEPSSGGNGATGGIVGEGGDSEVGGEDEDGVGGVGGGSGVGGIGGASGTDGCTPVHIGSVSRGIGIEYIVYTADINPNIFDSEPDILELRLNQNTTGAIDLGSAINTDFSSCEQCVIVKTDIDTEGIFDRLFFQQSGILYISSPSEGLDNHLIDATFEDVTLIEVTEAGSALTPVEGGECLTITGESLAVLPIDGWDCPVSYYNDGEQCNCECGIWDPDCDAVGTLVDGCAASTACVQVGGKGLCETGSSACTSIQFGNVRGGSDLEGLFFYYDADINPNIFGTRPDAIELLLYTADVGTFNFGSATNSGADSCEQCLVAFTDMYGSSYNKSFFQQSGILRINSTETDLWNDVIDATLENVVLIEVAASGSGVSPVAGGECLTISSGKLLIQQIAGWECPRNYYSDDYCDCTCGIWDPVCDSLGDSPYDCGTGKICVKDAHGFPECVDP